jgi:hypothetical protein
LTIDILTLDQDDVILIDMGCVQAWSAQALGDLWWRNFVAFSGKLGWALGREIERYKKEREEEIRKQQWEMTRAPSMILHKEVLQKGSRCRLCYIYSRYTFMELFQ